MGKNYSSIDYLLNLPNKEMGHVGLGIVLKDEKIAEKNFSEVKEFIHEEKLNNYIEDVPDKPKITQELKNLGVSAISNPGFPDHKAISEQKLSDMQIHIESQKSPEESKTWLAKFLKRNLFHKNNKNLVSDKSGVRTVDLK